MANYYLDKDDITKYDIDIKDAIDSIRLKLNNKTDNDAIFKATEYNIKCSNLRICILDKYKQDILNGKKNENIFKDIVVNIYNNEINKNSPQIEKKPPNKTKPTDNSGKTKKESLNSDNKNINTNIEKKAKKGKKRQKSLFDF